MKAARYSQNVINRYFIASGQAENFHDSRAHPVAREPGLLEVSCDADLAPELVGTDIARACPCIGRFDFIPIGASGVFGNGRNQQFGDIVGMPGGWNLGGFSQISGVSGLGGFINIFVFLAKLRKIAAFFFEYFIPVRRYATHFPPAGDCDTAGTG